MLGQLGLQEMHIVKPSADELVKFDFESIKIECILSRSLLGNVITMCVAILCLLCIMAAVQL